VVVEVGEVDSFFLSLLGVSGGVLDLDCGFDFSCLTFAISALE